MAASATEKTKNNIHQREPLLTKFVMSPIRGLNQAFGHLSGMGFKTVIAPLFAFSAVAVGTETLYRAMPDMNWSIPRDERAFIPKIGFEDGAELSRLVPLKAPAYAALRYVSPGFIDRYIPTGAGRTVWADPAFWVAIAICAAIQYQESKLFQRKDYAEVRRDAEQANATTRMKTNPSALDIAKTKVARHNAYGKGEETKSGATIILLYGAEALSCFYGLRGATSAVAVIGWGLMSIFGFEIFWNRDGQANERQG